MSFGFSVGDIILVSQLAYGLYSTVSSGRKAASRDLKELEEVLFSLKCALDHLKDVSKDVLTRPGLQNGDMGFKEKLDKMISSCASTLQELDTVTKKYRRAENEAGREKTNLRTLEDVKKSIRVNWQRVRWDREKQSLQQYREKLKSHTDAINLILTSAVWATITSAGESSKKNHEKTQTLLGEVLRNPAVNTEFRAMVKEIHAVLIKPKPDPEEVQMEAIPSTGSAYNEVDVTANSLSGSLFGESRSPKAEETPMSTMEDTSSPHDQLDIAAYSLSGSSLGESSSPTETYGKGLPSVSMYAMSDLPYRTLTAMAYTCALSGEISMQRAIGVRARKRQPTTESELPYKYSTRYRELPVAAVALNNERRALGERQGETRRERLAGYAELPSATIQLNNKRRAFGAKEYEAYKERHVQPKKVSKPSFLTSMAPTSQELQACIPHIFQSTAEGKQQTQELKNGMSRWTHEFSRFVNDESLAQRVKDECLLTLLGALNEAVDSSTGKTRRLFYESSDSAGFTAVLDLIATVSKSVRVMKEIEEFQDAKEEWSEQTFR